jgi:hypothetical protein
MKIFKKENKYNQHKKNLKFITFKNFKVRNKYKKNIKE